MKKMIFAIPAEATAIPVKPSNAATNAMTKNPRAQRNILSSCESSVLSELARLTEVRNATVITKVF
jgi:hypothetical protein